MGKTFPHSNSFKIIVSYLRRTTNTWRARWSHFRVLSTPVICVCVQKDEGRNIKNRVKIFLSTPFMPRTISVLCCRHKKPRQGMYAWFNAIIYKPKKTRNYCELRILLWNGFNTSWMKRGQKFSFKFTDFSLHCRDDDFRNGHSCV